MVFEDELAVKLHAKVIEVWTSSDRNPRQDRVTRAGLTVLDLLITKALVSLGFSIMHRWLHYSWFLAKYLIWEAATAGLSHGLRTTASSVESSAYANSLFSTSSNISLVYRINSRGPNTRPCAMPEIIGIHSLAAPSTTTLCLRSERNSVQMDSTLPPTPIVFDLNKRPLWLTLSKAALKSSWTI